MVALVLVAVALGMSNLAAAAGIGVSGGGRGGGAGARLRARVAIVFGLFEAGMPVLGLALRHGVAASAGSGVRWLGGGLLVAVGCYGIARVWWERWRTDDGNGGGGHAGGVGGRASGGDWGLGRMAVSGLALSVDNLAAGFALGAYHVSLGVAVAVIALVSIAMSLAGLELGARLGNLTGPRGELAAGVVLIGVGVAMAAGVM